ncbi:hypothetical protein ACET3Z_020589 [Daucus carota]
MLRRHAFFLLILVLSFSGDSGRASAYIFRQGSVVDKQNSLNPVPFSGCRNGNRKLGLLNCKNGVGFTNMDGPAARSRVLKTAVLPPPAPTVGVTVHQTKPLKRAPHN